MVRRRDYGRLIFLSCLSPVFCFYFYNDALVLITKTPPIGRYTDGYSWATYYGFSPESYWKLVPHRDLYIFPSLYVDNHCVEVQRDWKISKQVCSLPPYCGQTAYHEIDRDSWWITKTGICIGLGSTIFVHAPQPGIIPPRDWCIHYTVELQREDPTFKSVNDHVLKCGDEYRIISPMFISSFPSLDANYEVALPNLTEVQGRYCLPTVTASIFPVMSDPTTYDRALGRAVKFIHAAAPVTQKFWVDYFTFYDPITQKFVVDDNSMKVECDAFKSTNNILPFTYSSIGRVVGDLSYIVLHCIYVLIYRGVISIIYALSFFFDFLTFLSFLLLSYHFTSHSLFDAAVYSLGAAIVVQFFTGRSLVHLDNAPLEAASGPA